MFIIVKVMDLQKFIISKNYYNQIFNFIKILLLEFMDL